MSRCRLRRASRIHDYVGTKNRYKSIHLGLGRFRGHRYADGYNNFPHERRSEHCLAKTYVHDCDRHFDLVRLKHRQ